VEQATLVRELYKACLERDQRRERELLCAEIAMVLKRRADNGGAFDNSWTIVTGTCGDVPVHVDAAEPGMSDFRFKI
jgi:hypothetical protein